MPEREVLSVSLDPALAERLRAVAAEQDRSMSALIRRAVRVALAEYDTEARA
jgi:metal-responsive CopG/Arc/MetJ family transcriptional regulator